MPDDEFEDDIDHEFNQGYKGKGTLSNLKSFELKHEYEDLIARFEEWLEDDDFYTKDDLHDKLKKWLPNIPIQPKQRQMNLYTEYYDLPYQDIPEEELYYYHEFKRGEYRSDKKTWSDAPTGRLDVPVEEAVYHMKYGDRIVLRRVDNKRIMAHYRDVKEGVFLSVKKE